jgi:hypothetical protein
MKEKIQRNLAGSILNTTLFRLILEIQGRQLIGALTVIKIQVYELIQSVLINPKIILEKHRNRLISIFGKIATREIGSIFDELDASTPEEVSLDKVKPDRRELDKIIMGEILGLSEEEQLEVYRAVVDLVKSRIEKAKSVGKNKKMVEGVDIGALKKTVLGEFKKQSEL